MLETYFFSIFLFFVKNCFFIYIKINKFLVQSLYAVFFNTKKFNFQVEEFDDIKSGYRIKFTFDPNEFFENTEITKEFQLGGHEPTSSTTEIKWKPGKKKVFIFYLFFLFFFSSKIQLTNGRDDELPKSFFDWLCNNLDPISDDMAEVCTCFNKKFSQMFDLCNKLLFLGY